MRIAWVVDSGHLIERRSWPDHNIKYLDLSQRRPLEAVDGVKAAVAKNLIAAGFRDVEALFQVINEAKKLLEQA